MRLGEIATVVSGQHVLAKLVNAERIGVPYLTGPSDFGEDAPQATGWTAHGTAFARPKDVLITVKGSGCGSTMVSDGNYAIGRQLMAIRAEHCQPAFLSVALSFELGHLKAAAAGTIPGLTRAQILGIELPHLSSLEQQVLGSIDASANKVLTTLRRLTLLKSDFRRGLMHALLDGDNRIDSQASATRAYAKLGDHTQEVIIRNGSRMREEKVMGVFKDIGLRPMRDHVRASDLTRYKIVPRDAFAYNPMRLNIGSIARNNLTEECLVSPDYVVMQANTDSLLPAYLDQVRRSQTWRQFVRPAGMGSVRVRIYYSDLRDMRIPLPPITEQARIVKSLEAFDREIALLGKLSRAYGKERREVLQRLLAGQREMPRQAKMNEDRANAGR